MTVMSSNRVEFYFVLCVPLDRLDVRHCLVLVHLDLLCCYYGRHVRLDYNLMAASIHLGAAASILLVVDRNFHDDHSRYYNSVQEDHRDASAHRMILGRVGGLNNAIRTKPQLVIVTIKSLWWSVISTVEVASHSI